MKCAKVLFLPRRLAWLLAQGPDVLPIPGTKQLARVKENLGALAVTLTDAERDALVSAIPLGAAAGGRYGEAALQKTFR